MNPYLDWSEVDCVLLDMDGTILDLEFDNYFWLEYLPRVYAEKNSISLQEGKQFLADSYGKLKGKLQWYCLDFWSERLQLDIVELKYLIKERVAFRPGAVEFLEFLVDSKKEVYLATNAHPKSLEIKLLITDFHQYFRHLISSHEFGYPKEEQEYWRLLHKKYHFNRERTLFIDDSVKILKSARQFGIKYLFGIAQPDLSREPIDCSPFEAIEDFSGIIQHD